jgi:hypothetical protein
MLINNPSCLTESVFRVLIWVYKENIIECIFHARIWMLKGMILISLVRLLWIKPKIYHIQGKHLCQPLHHQVGWMEVQRMILNKNLLTFRSLHGRCTLLYFPPALRQTGSRNLTGPKTLPTIWGTYMKLVTKYQISAINSSWEKCAYMFNVYRNQLSRQTGSRNLTGI